MNAPITIIYIACQSHSGSTLLDLLISSHSQVIGLGEVKVLSNKRRKNNPNRRLPLDNLCACLRYIKECPFWSQVDAQLRQADGLSLESLELYHPDPETFKKHNRALFSAASEVSGCRYIVDLSKDIFRYERLVLHDVLDLCPIHLVRSPYGVVYSQLKKGRNLLHHARRYNRKLMETRKRFASKDHFFVRYEDLAQAPIDILPKIMTWLKLPFEEEQLNWSAHQHHHMSGNRMRYKKDCVIKLDTGWKAGLNQMQKVCIFVNTLLARMAVEGRESGPHIINPQRLRIKN